MSKEKIPVTVRLDKNLRRDIKVYCAKTGLKIQSFVEQAITYYLTNLNGKK